MTKPWLAFYDEAVPTELNIPSITIADLLKTAAKNHPKHIGCVFMDARLTYGELQQQVEKLAAALYHLGIRKGDKVAIMMPNCPQTMIAYYATLSLGAVTVMTNPLYVQRELEHQWHDSQVDIVISLDLFWPQIDKVRRQLPLKQIILSGIQDYLAWHKRTLAPWKLKREGKWVDVPYGENIHSFKKLIGRNYPQPPPITLTPADIACLQYTGGTTGLPKGAMLRHQNIIAGITQLKQFLFYEQKEAEETALAIMPFFHIYGMNALMNLGVLFAATLVLIPRPEIKAIVDAMIAERPTFFAAVPALFSALNTYRSIDQVDLTSVKAVFSGAAPLPLDVLTTFEARTGARIAEAYGMTETSLITHSNPMKGVRKNGSIGIPVLGTDAKIVDVNDPDKILGVGQEGELMVRGPQVMQGYWNKPEENENILLDGWLRTGDIALMDEDGYFFIVDRKKDMMLSAGFNVYPREVEEVLYQHPKVQEAAVIGLPDGIRGEKITAYIKLIPGETATAAEIRTFCRDLLAPYKQPRTVVFKDDLPKSMAGKILRRQLKEEALAELEKNPSRTVAS